MEEQKNIFELSLTEDGKSNFSSIAQWAFINALVSFIALGITIAGTLMATPVNDDPAVRAMAKGTGLITVLVTAAISLLLNVTLISSANNLKKGLAGSDQGYFNAGLLKMASYFKIMGILLIVVMAFFFLAVLVAIMAGVS